MIYKSIKSDDLKNKFSNLSDDELLEFINNGKNLVGDELFLANRELRIRKQLNYFEKKIGNFNVKSIQKKLRIPFYYRIDFLSLLIAALSIVSIYLVVNFVLYSTPKINYSMYNQITTGIVRNIETKSGYVQDFDGATNITVGYVIHYEYKVNLVYYSGSMLIASKPGNSDFVEYLSRKLGKGIICVRYKESEPEKSIIDTYEVE